MIKLNAISSGYAVPRKDFDGSVHSVFREAANLQLVKAGRLVTLVTARCADLPQGIRIATPENFSFEAILQPEDKLSCRSGELADLEGRIEIDLASAMRWKCSLPVLKPNEMTPQVVLAWMMAWQLLLQHQKEANADIQGEALLQTGKHRGDALSRRICELARELIEAVRNCDNPVETSLEGLIGLGRGLTPSGDDFLVGFLAGLRCQTGDRSDRSRYLRELGKRVIRLSHRTNDISCTSLYYATHGQVSSRLAELAQSIAGGSNSEPLHKVAIAALQEGHTSGMDSVTGLLVGLATWGNGSFPV